MKFLSVYILMLPIMLMGCESLNEQEVPVQAAENLQGDKYFNDKSSDLIKQLLQVEQFDYKSKPIAFTTIVWMDTLTLKSEKRSSSLLGHQISSSLKTELIQKGGNVVEHKSSQAISMSEDASYYLTRKIKDLSTDIEVSYVLAGTMLDIKGGVEVNIQVIDVESHSVVSSARTFISNDYLPELNNVVVKEGKIYRGQL